MARFIQPDYQQSQWMELSFDQLVEPGSFDYAMFHLVEGRYDDSFLAEHFSNDDNGRPAIHPKTLLKVLLAGYSRGILSSRKLEQACKHHAVFMALTGRASPDHSTIALFVRKLEGKLPAIFADVLCVCHEEGLLDGTRFAVDGLKLPADASREWSGSFQELKRKRDKFIKRAKALMKEHKKRDRRLAKGKSETAIPEIPAHEKLLAKAAKIDAFLEKNEPRKGASGKEVKSNITDPESSKMPTSKGMVQGYNAQAVVDEKHQVVTAAELASGGQDGNVLGELFEQASSTSKQAGLGEDYYKGSELLADANYHSESNLEACEKAGVDAVIPDPNFRSRDERHEGRDEHHIQKIRPSTKRFTVADFEHDTEEDVYLCPRGRKLTVVQKESRCASGLYRKYRADSDFCEICEFRDQCLKPGAKRRMLSVRMETGRPLCEEMRRKVDSKEGRHRYSRRMGIVEPVFGNIRHAKGMNRFYYRGRKMVRVQWMLFCLVHNIGKIARYGAIHAQSSSETCPAGS
jgi:transposase